MEERRGSILERCLEWCYTRCFGYGQHDFQTNGSSRRDRFVSGCEICCKRTCSCLCCLPCYDFICDRCVGHSFCYKCLHCSCFYSDDKEDLPDCDTTPGLVRQSSVKSLDKYVSPCAATNFSILDQPKAIPTDTNKPPNVTTSAQSGGSSSKMNVKAITHQPPRLSLLISKKNPYQQMQSTSTSAIPEEHDNSAIENDEDFPHETTIRDEVEVHETEGDTGEEEINTAKAEPENLNTNIFIKDYKQTTV